MTRSQLTFLAVLAAVAAPAAGQSEETVYLELWRQPAAADAPEMPMTAAPRMLVAVGRPSSDAVPIARWCQEQRDRGGSPVLPRALLHDAPYDLFTSGAVPVRFEILIDDVEMRYALGSERPAGATGLEFPFFELCALGYGSRSEPEWALDMLHLANHRGDEVAFGLYKGALPIGERAYLESQLGYPTALPDPAGALLLGQGQDVQTLLLVLSTDGSAFDQLRRRIVR
jgi:hypothetical protein